MGPRNTISILVSLLIGVSTVFSQTPTPVPAPGETDYSMAIQNLYDFIPDKMMDEHVKGLSLALVDGDRIVWVKGFGYADADKRIHATGDTLYHLGAVSKIFTAAEVLKLVGEGKIGLDKPLRKYLPEFSIHSRFKRVKALTVRSLLASHSGLPGFFLKGLWVDHPEGLEDFVSDLKSDYLVAPPQSLYKYSYVDYDLLGRLVEVKRKEAFADAVKEDLFDPLGMDSSSLDNSSDINPQLAQGYRKGDQVDLIHLRDTPAAGMVSSANDLAKFLQVVLGGEDLGNQMPIQNKILHSMFKPQYPDIPLDLGHQVGMGWQLTGLNIEGSQGTAWHDGIYPPYDAQLTVLYRQGLGVIFLSNSEEGDKLREEVTVRALKLMLQAKYGIPEDLKKKKIEMPKTVEVPLEQLDQDAGYYSALGQLMKVTRQDGHLAAEWDGHQLDLLPISQDTFVPHITFIIFPIDLPQFPITFSRVEEQVTGVLGGLAFPVPLQKIQPVEIPQAWKDREGDYELENPDGQFQFSRISLGEKEGFLTVTLKVSFKPFDVKDQEFKVALLPLSDEDAVIPGLFYGDGGTLHVGEDGPTRVYYSGYWFTKKASLKPTPAVSPTPRPPI
jgi:CubicO group peptidase (beta-lactamase class C family)